KFRADFIDLCGIDPFESVTIASACQKQYKTFMMERDEIAVISANGYQLNRLSSFEATEWLEWKKLEYPDLQYAGNGREFKLGVTLLMGTMKSPRPSLSTTATSFMAVTICPEPTDRVLFGKL